MLQHTNKKQLAPSYKKLDQVQLLIKYKVDRWRINEDVTTQKLLDLA